MYLEEVKMNFIQPCTADAARIRFKAKFSTDISEILPYINAVVKDAIYNKKVQSLTIRKEFRIITIYGTNLAVSKAINESEAYEIMDLVKDLVNKTYERKDEIEPLYEMREKPDILQVYKYLPKLNCKKCGESTCLAFASKLLSGIQKIKKCGHIYEEANRENLDKVENMLQIMGYE
ncbi:(Fe-S)-binding protein [Tepidibacter aestuarii]|uniref:(Fe-S)-binding protein n=1 Tax=Tepidibacter aestuarii TaxID=2925782 RepID=UPI0020C12A2A|nr:(Fe-S)-binding protein [Tepidibacter aestuarii]CAH2212229.1 putative Metal-binding trascriptional regulator, contains Fe-S cluster and ArsR family DNA binding domain [Tepidibacter aestuarii]